MTSNEIINDLRIKNIINELSYIKNKKYSDITDNNGNQYVDLVLEGGGVLGVALLGYIYVLEKAGIRFFNVGGTSAGAITAVMVSILKENNSGEKLLNEFLNKNILELLDAPSYVKEIFKTNKYLDVIKLSINNFKKIFIDLYEKKGFAKGEDFEIWIDNILKKHNCLSINEYNNQLQYNNKLFFNKRQINIKRKLSIISTDITTLTKVEFPKMKNLYWSSNKNIKLSKLIRASMNVPILFKEYVVKDIPNSNNENDKLWIKHVNYKGKIPNEVTFLDGGLISNFPINMFHITGVPKKPTFGVKLSKYRQLDNLTISVINEYKKLYKGTFHTLKYEDYSSIDYRTITCNIEANDKYSWLDFTLDKTSQKELFIMGAEKALTFLKTFDWDEYKKIRRNENI